MVACLFLSLVVTDFGAVPTHAQSLPQEPSAKNAESKVEPAPSAPESVDSRQPDEADAPDPLAVLETLAQMRKAEKRLTDSDTGEQTRAAQQDVLDNLDKLIDRAQQQENRRNQRRQQQQNQQSSQQQQSQQNQSQSSQQSGGQDSTQRNRQQSGGGRRQSGENSQDATATVETGEAVDAKLARQRQVLIQEIWGHLPPRLRNRVLNLNDEKFLPKYEDLIRNYFRAISEETSPDPTRP